MEGYYDKTIFHRVVKDFIVQGGDPTGTGEGGESIYGKPFKVDFHSHLLPKSPYINKGGLSALYYFVNIYVLSLHIIRMNSTQGCGL